MKSGSAFSSILVVVLSLFMAFQFPLSLSAQSTGGPGDGSFQLLSSPSVAQLDWSKKQSTPPRAPKINLLLILACVAVVGTVAAITLPHIKGCLNNINQNVNPTYPNLVYTNGEPWYLTNVVRVPGADETIKYEPIYIPFPFPGATPLTNNPPWHSYTNIHPGDWSPTPGVTPPGPNLAQVSMNSTVVPTSGAYASVGGENQAMMLGADRTLRVGMRRGKTSMSGTSSWGDVFFTALITMDSFGGARVKLSNKNELPDSPNQSPGTRIDMDFPVEYGQTWWVPATLGEQTGWAQVREVKLDLTAEKFESIGAQTEYAAYFPEELRNRSAGSYFFPVINGLRAFPSAQ